MKNIKWKSYEWDLFFNISLKIKFFRMVKRKFSATIDKKSNKKVFFQITNFKKVLIVLTE